MRSTKMSLDIECQLSAEYFGKWDELPDEILTFWDDKGCNCEDVEVPGTMGIWCENCPFCLKFVVKDDQHPN